MILELLLKACFGVLKGILFMVPSADSFEVPMGVFQWVTSMIQVMHYFVPVGDFILMLTIWFGVTNFQIIWRVIQRIWDALPFT